MSDSPLHRRSVVIDCFEEDGHVRTVGRLRDERPWHETVPVLHDMELLLTVQLSDMVITSAEAIMHAFPHDECPFIQPKFAGMVGLSISRGFTRSLRELFAGVSGCQHLHELARVTGPAVFQATTSLRARQRTAADQAPFDPEIAVRAMGGTCHVWQKGGVVEQKLALGWIPGTTRYPAPSAEEYRASQES